MSTTLQLLSAPGRMMLCLIVSTLLSPKIFAQGPTPALTIREGLPANDDQYTAFFFANNTYMAILTEPVRFFTSTDARVWQRIPGPFLGDPGASLAIAIQRPAVAYGAGLWVVVSDSGKIFTSANLVDWTQEVSGTTAKLAQVTYVDSGFYCVGDSATLLTSSDGVSWIRRTIPQATGVEPFNQVSRGLGYLVVSAYDATNDASLVFRSTTGAGGSWSVDTLADFATVKFVRDRFYQYLGGGYYSFDAHSWLPTQGVNGFSDIFGDSNQVYAMLPVGATSQVAASSDGVNFGTPVNIPTGAENGAYGGGRYFAFGQNASEAPDAVNWFQPGSYGGTAAFKGTTYVKNLPTSSQTSVFFSSPDFVNWTAVDTVSNPAVLLYDSTKFFGLGPTSYTSADGSAWPSDGNPPLELAFADFHITYGGGTYVAWFSNSPTNTVWYSHDGVNWGGSALPPPTEQEFFDGYNSQVMQITNIQYINGRFWLLNAAEGEVPASIWISGDGTNFTTPGFNNTWAGSYVANSYDQLLYVPDSSKYFLFGTGSTAGARASFFSVMTTNPLDSTIVLQNNTVLTGPLVSQNVSTGNIAYGMPNFFDPGGYDFGYSHGHFVGSAQGWGNPVDPNIPAYSYVMWSSDGQTWDGTRIDGYAKVLSNLVGNDTFRMEAWNNFEFIASFTDSAAEPDSLLNFSAVAVNNTSVLLSWQVEAGAGATAFREFVVERRVPGSRWTILDSLAATTATSYTYTDGSPAVGENDYRLLLRGPDTTTSFSLVRVVQIAQPEHFALFPNPARNYVIITADPAITGVVRIFTADGRLVKQQVMSGSQVTISLAGLPTGTYSVVIRQTDGTTYNRSIFHIE